MSDGVWIHLGPAGGELRQRIEETYGEPLGSDMCVAVMIGQDVIGWGDDYGTFHPMTRNGAISEVKKEAETLLEAAFDLWLADGVMRRSLVR